MLRAHRAPIRDAAENPPTAARVSTVAFDALHHNPYIRADPMTTTHRGPSQGRRQDCMELHDLLVANALHAGLFADMRQPMLALDRDSLDVLAANAAAVALCGWPRDDLLTGPIDRLFAPGEARGFRDHLGLHPNDSVPPFTCRHLRGDGRQLTVRLHVQPLCVEGRWVRLLSIDDVTETVARESWWLLLERSIQQASDIVMITEAGPADDPGPRFVFLNPAFERVTGWRIEDAIGRSPSILYGPDTSRRALARIRQGMLARTAVHEELVNIRKDGEPFWMSLDITPVDDGERWFIACGRDITLQRRRAERVLQEHKMAAIGRLAGGIAHDFNNLLTTILGHSDLVLESLGETDPLRDSLDEVRHAAARAANLTSQLLAFGRRQLLQPRVLDLRTQLPAMLSLLEPLLGPTIEIQIDVAPDTTPVSWDPMQLESVLVALAINAREAMADGGRFVLSTANREEPGSDGRMRRYVAIAIADTGVGMDAGTRDHMFEPFFSTKHRGPSGGMSLASVYGIVEQSGGHIEVASSPGNGTRIELLLPQAETVGRGLEAGDVHTGERHAESSHSPRVTWGP